jgi:TetR/AcrR family transcriptional regulator, transcriptional repressor for nem operon
MKPYMTADTRERLIESAIDLVLTSGYHAIGVKEICQHAHVQKGSFYHFFPSKRELVIEALNRQWARHTQLLLDPVFNDPIPPLNRIVKMFEVMSEHQAHLQKTYGRVYGCPFGNLAQELSTHDEVLRNKLTTIFYAWTRYIETALAEAVALDALPITTPISQTAQSILAYLEGLMLMAKTFNDPSLIQRAAPTAVTMIKNMEI